MKPEHCQIEICDPGGQVLETLTLWDLLELAAEYRCPGVGTPWDRVLGEPGMFARVTALGGNIVMDVESPRQPEGRDLNQTPEYLDVPQALRSGDD